jgi:hypothetical protein
VVAVVAVAAMTAPAAVELAVRALLLCVTQSVWQYLLSVEP